MIAMLKMLLLFAVADSFVDHKSKDEHLYIFKSCT
jgi:hypothetical protein